MKAYRGREGLVTLTIKVGTTSVYVNYVATEVN